MNQSLLELLNIFAAEKNATQAQISLAWILYKDDFIAPIPGMRSIASIKENLDATNVILTPSEYQQLEVASSKIKVFGNRTDEDIAKLYN